MKYQFSIKDICEIAAASVGIPGWRWIRWQKMDAGGSLVTGYVPQTYKRGPKKGEPRLGAPTPGTERKVVVSDADMDAAAAKYEAETGLCWHCKGTGQVAVGWSRAEGIRYETCRRCAGTGKARGKVA